MVAVAQPYNFKKHDTKTPILRAFIFIASFLTAKFKLAKWARY